MLMHLAEIEAGATVPPLATLEATAQALQIPQSELFFDGNRPPHAPNLIYGKPASGSEPEQLLAEKRASRPG